MTAPLPPGIDADPVRCGTWQENRVTGSEALALKILGLACTGREPMPEE